MFTTCKNTKLEISKCASVEALRLGEQHLNAAMMVAIRAKKFDHTNTLPIRKRLAPNRGVFWGSQKPPPSQKFS